MRACATWMWALILKCYSEDEHHSCTCQPYRWCSAAFCDEIIAVTRNCRFSLVCGPEGLATDSKEFHWVLFGSFLLYGRYLLVVTGVMAGRDRECLWERPDDWYCRVSSNFPLENDKHHLECSSYKTRFEWQQKKENWPQPYRPGLPPRVLPAPAYLLTCLAWADQWIASTGVY